MKIHHFYPRTLNLGDHFVQRGIETLFRSLVPNVEFELFDVNACGKDRVNFGLTHNSVERANREADLVVIGGSNLFEARRFWGVHMEPGALDKLRVPLILLGIGTGSHFLARPPKPSRSVAAEIRKLTQRSVLSGVRDVVTLDWLRQLGINNAKLSGDPATFIFNRPFRHAGSNSYVFVAMPPVRYWRGTSRREYFDPRGPTMFKTLANELKRFGAEGTKLVVVCNDPRDQALANWLFGETLGGVLWPQEPEEYFELLSRARAVVCGRLHTAVVSFSLGIPFMLLDLDQRTSGFLKTYGLDHWAVRPSLLGFRRRLRDAMNRLMETDSGPEWEGLIEKRNAMREQALELLHSALTQASALR